MHHSQERDDNVIRRLMREAGQPLGATGQFPDGKLTPKDEGEIRFAVAHTAEKVVIDFGEPTAWVGMTPEQALDLSFALRKHAQECRAAQKKGK